MKDLAIAIRVGSPHSRLQIVRNTIESIEKNIGDCDYYFIISLDPQVSHEVKKYIYLKAMIAPERFKLLPLERIYWSEFINKAIQLASDAEYFIKAHDDIILYTHDFFPKVMRELKKIKNKIAWISFDSIDYLRGYWITPTRQGYFKDTVNNLAWENRQLFQFHDLPAKWNQPQKLRLYLYYLTSKLGKYFKFLSKIKYPNKPMPLKLIKKLDIPEGPVKAHAPWNTFVMIKMSVLKKLGPCENWQTHNALLVDEDWGLRALEKKYWNIWIPNIRYEHYRTDVPMGGNRSQQYILSSSQRVHRAFKKKWGFSSEPSKQELQFIKRKYKNTHIPWSIDKNSYEWELLT